MEAAGGKDVLVGGGASTVQQYLRAGMFDEMHFATSPVLLGGSERLFDHLDGGTRGYEWSSWSAQGPPRTSGWSAVGVRGQGV